MRDGLLYKHDFATEDSSRILMITFIRSLQEPHENPTRREPAHLITYFSPRGKIRGKRQLAAQKDSNKEIS